MKILLAGLPSRDVSRSARHLEASGMPVVRESDLDRAVRIVKEGGVRVVAMTLDDSPAAWRLVAAAAGSADPARVVAVASRPIAADLRRRAYGAGVWELIEAPAGPSRHAALLLDGVRRALSERLDPCVLFVDACSDITDGIGSLIADEGFVVEAATTTAEAVRLMSARDYSLVITEVRRPGPDGFEVIRSAHRLQPGVPVVVLTASPGDAVLLRAIELGARDCLWKLAETDAILGALKDALAPLGATGPRTLSEES